MKRKGFSPIIILLLIAVLAVAGYFGYKYFKPINELIPSSPASSPSSSLVPTSSPLSTTSKLYLLKLKLKSDSRIPPVGAGTQSEFARLTDYVASLLKLPEKSVSQLLYDTRVTSPYGVDKLPYNSTFYAILSQAATLNASYEDQYITVDTQTVDDALLPYLIKPDYCEKDSDCSLNADMCTQGAFNFYKKYVDPPWGCGPGGYKSNYSWFQWGEHDATLNCDVELKFDGAKCTNNQCTETGFKKVCIE